MFHVSKRCISSGSFLVQVQTSANWEDLRHTKLPDSYAKLWLYCKERFFLGGALNGTRRHYDYRSVGLYFLHPPGKATLLEYRYDIWLPGANASNLQLFAFSRWLFRARTETVLQCATSLVKCNLSISSWRLYDKNIVLLTLKTRSTKQLVCRNYAMVKLGDSKTFLNLRPVASKSGRTASIQAPPFRHFTCLIHLYFNWRLHGIIRSFSFVESSGSDLRSLDIQNPPNIWWLGVWNP